MGKKRAAAAAMANAYLCIKNSPYVELIVLALYPRVVFPSPQSETRTEKLPKTGGSDLPLTLEPTFPRWPPISGSDCAILAFRAPVA
jgi:hypothetical protein